MVITYQGGECFKVSFGDTTLAFNPISKDSKLPSTKFGSDIVLSTLADPDMNGVENASFGERAPFVVSGPGEYEIKDIVIKGFASESDYKKKGRKNTIYFISLEGMNLCFLGALSTPDLPQDAKQELEDVDILFTPIGGEGVLDAADAYKLAVKLEPHVVIPMHWGAIEGSKEVALKDFLKESGESVKPIEKLTLKKKDLEEKEGEIIVLSV
ncbi:MAG TPA: MBL fold metallo-hydrolase [Candidatus Paceibacterota bacterium]